MSKRDLLNLESLSSEIEGLIDRALYFKKNRLSVDETRLLQGKSIGLFFEKPSTRTRVAFEAAIVRLGGHPIFLTPNDTQVNRGETIADTARVLSFYLDALVIRTFGQEKLTEWAAGATIPIINALSDLCHPCQALTDLLTILERRGSLRGLTLAYFGDGSNNMAYSLMEAGAIMGMNVTIACPTEYRPNEEWTEKFKRIAKKNGSKIVVTNDPMEAATNADILYTDTWVSMGTPDQESTDNQFKNRFRDYQINQQIVDCAKPDCLVMHCLPAHRGEEITDEVMEGKNSVIFEQAANRLPMHQAILEWALMGK